jgi:hypothetical protein
MTAKGNGPANPTLNRAAIEDGVGGRCNGDRLETWAIFYPVGGPVYGDYAR